MSLLNLLNPQDNLHYRSFDEDKKIITEAIEQLNKNYKLERFDQSKESSLQESIQKFSGFMDYDQVFLLDSVEIVKNNTTSILSIVSINSSFHMGKSQTEHTLTELEFVGLAFLQKDYGNVLIRRETIADKINELINKKEVDFEIDKEFSRKYYVLASDKEKLKRNILHTVLSSIKKQKDAEIEIIDSVMLIRIRKPVSISTAFAIAELLTEINDGIN